MLRKLNSLLLSLLAAFIVVSFSSCDTSDNVSPAQEEQQAIQSVVENTPHEDADAGDAETGHPAKKEEEQQKTEQPKAELAFDYSSIPQYSGEPYYEVNGNIPYFTDADYTTEAFETYSELDSLGRCGVAFANVCKEIMPTEERGEIGMIKPSGWQTIRYNGVVDGNYLYNRCHLIGYQLAGENANEKNLITGTRYLNVTGMLPFENMVDDYVDETSNHVLYRVTPIFEGSNLLASGVLIEAYSVEDNGSLSFCVFCYNVQPSIEINYATGESSLIETTKEETPVASKEEPKEEVKEEPKEEAPAQTHETNEITYVLNVKSMKFHLPTCSGLPTANRQDTTETRDAVIAKGYEPCKKCNP